MEINNRIASILNYESGPFLIEMNEGSFNKLTNYTLKVLKSKNIKISINNKIKSMKIIKHKVDCFAYKDKHCLALSKIDCEHCNFYRNDITLDEIEKAVTTYSGFLGGECNDRRK